MKALEITQYRVVSAYAKQSDGQAGSAVVGAEGKRHRTVAGLDGTRRRCRRPDGDAGLGAGTGEALNEPDDLLEASSRGDRQLSVPARCLDLWRHERDPEEHPDESGAEAVMDFDLSDDQRLLTDSVTRLMADQYSFAARKDYLKEAARLELRRCGGNSPSSGCWGCRSPRNTVGSAAARSRPCW